MERPRPEQPWNPVADDPTPEHAFNRFVVAGEGLRESDRAAAEEVVSEHYARLFSEGGAPEGREVPMTREQREACEAVLAGLGEFVRRYGGNPVPLGADQVRAVELNERSPRGSEQWSSWFSSNTQRLYLKVGTAGGASLFDAKLPGMVAHEALHANSFRSSTIRTTAGETVGQPVIRGSSARRSGLAVGTGGRAIVGGWLNEALTEDLTIRYLKKIQLPVSKQQEEAVDTLLAEHPDLDREEIVGILESDGDRAPIVALRAYKAERDKFHALIDDLAARHPGEFHDREAVFEMFANAYFTGNLLPLGRVLESAYGKNALRRLMEGEEIWAEEEGLEVEWEE